MSADNSIVTLKSPKRNGEGFEYRVQDISSAHWDFCEVEQREGNCDSIIKNLRRYFAGCAVHSTVEAAEAEGDALDAQLQESGLPEYGPCRLTLTVPL